MCGRYTITDPTGIYERFGVLSEHGDVLSAYEPKYNLAPGMMAPVITRNSPNSVVIMKWGLIPSWAKDPKIGYKMINARADTVSEKPSYRSSFKKKRCLVPADGFFEWAKTEEGKVPHYFKLKDSRLFSFAGLYDIWKDAEGKEIYSYTIITGSPNDLVRSVHDRMPVILAKGEEDKWLSPTTSSEELLKLLDPYPVSEMDYYRVSVEVNKPQNNTLDLIEPVVTP